MLPVSVALPWTCVASTVRRCVASSGPKASCGSDLRPKLSLLHAEPERRLGKNEHVDLKLERAVRDAAIVFLQSVVDAEGVVSSADLRRFTFNNERVFLVGPQGIFKPKQLALPLSIKTVPPVDGREPPYLDQFDEHDTLHYRYRGTDPQFHENVGLRRLMEAGLPLVYFHGLDKGRYLAAAALMAADRPADLTFEVDLTELDVALPGHDRSSFELAQGTNKMRLLKARINQASFRERVMKAYQSACALCRLRHAVLLDAAHIRPHAEGGSSIVPNGMSLCKIHHAAFDAGILGIRPDLVAEIRSDVMLETDGPMLAHGIQALNGTRLLHPRVKLLRPDVDALEYRYEQFRAAG